MFCTAFVLAANVVFSSAMSMVVAFSSLDCLSYSGQQPWDACYKFLHMPSWLWLPSLQFWFYLNYFFR